MMEQISTEIRIWPVRTYIFLWLWLVFDVTLILTQKKNNCKISDSLTQYFLCCRETRKGQTHLFKVLTPQQKSWHADEVGIVKQVPSVISQTSSVICKRLIFTEHRSESVLMFQDYFVFCICNFTTIKIIDSKASLYFWSIIICPSKRYFFSLFTWQNWLNEWRQDRQYVTIHLYSDSFWKDLFRFFCNAAITTRHNIWE